MTPPLSAKSKKNSKKGAKLKRIKKNREYLLLLSHCSQKLRKIVLKSGNENLIKAILEIIVNTLKGNANIGQNKFKVEKKSSRSGGWPFEGALISTTALISGVLNHIFSNGNKKKQQ